MSYKRVEVLFWRANRWSSSKQYSLAVHNLNLSLHTVAQRQTLTTDRALGLLVALVEGDRGSQNVMPPWIILLEIDHLENYRATLATPRCLIEIGENMSHLSIGGFFFRQRRVAGLEETERGEKNSV